MKIEGIDYSRDDKSNYFGKPQVFTNDKDEIIAVNNLIMLGHEVSLVSKSVLTFLESHTDDILEMIQTKYPETILKESYHEFTEYLESIK